MIGIVKIYEGMKYAALTCLMFGVTLIYRAYTIELNIEGYQFTILFIVPAVLFFAMLVVDKLFSKMIKGLKEGQLKK